MRNSARQTRRVQRNKFITAITVALLLSGWSATAAIPKTSAQKAIEAMGSNPVLRGSVWGVLAVTASGDTLVNVNGDMRMVPASNMKLITTGAALCRLGEDFRFVTKLGVRGEVRDSLLLGDLYLVGGGDPSLCDHYRRTGDSLATFSKWKKMLADAGIGGIRGKVVADARYFNGDDLLGDWCIEDVTPGCSSGAQGLNIGDNVGVQPPAAALHCAQEFTSWLRDGGFAVSGEPSDVPECPSDSLVTIGSIRSVRLSELVYVANHESENIYAEAMLRQMGKEMYGTAAYDTACLALAQVIRRIAPGLNPGEVRLADGSGLSRKNYVSPAFIVGFLRAMAGRREFKTYLRSLPRPGEGTLRARLGGPRSSLKDRVYMKSGSMTGVRCFSGYILPSDGDSGKMIAFSILTNNVVARGPAPAALVDEMIMRLAAEN